MNSEYLLYLQEIKDTEWVIELISEQFDDAMNMMTPNSVIYGGAVRDCLAGKALLGDLDIAVSASECTTMINKFVKNPKWVNVSNKLSGAHYKKFGSVSPFFGEPKRTRSYTKTPQIMTFKTLGNKTVQIIILEPTGDDPFQTVTTMVKQVDIVCCGVILTNDNKVFEVVPNAYKECKKHVLHLNNTCYVKDIENFKQRIEKLSERGWINEIDINKVIRTVNRRRKQNLESKNGIGERSSVTLENHTHNIEKHNFVNPSDQGTIMEQGYIVLRKQYTPKEGATGPEIEFNHAEGTETLTHTGYRSILSGEDIGSVGGLSDVMHALDVVAKKYRLDIIAQPVNNCLMIITKNRYVSNQVKERIIDSVAISPLSKAMSPLANKSLEGAAHVYAKTANPPMKKKQKLGITGRTTRSYAHPESTTRVYAHQEAAIKSHVQLHEEGESLAPTTIFEGISKRTLSDLNRKKELSESKAPRVERYFDYSTETKPKATANTHYHKLFKGDMALLGGIAIVLSRLEKIAKKHEIDIGVTVKDGITTIITRDGYIGRRVYELLLRRTTNVQLKTNTKSFGGTV